MQLDKIQVSSPKVPELVMNSLLDAINTGKIKVNDDLPPERELAEALGVGRGSLRESLAVLEFMGVIETRGNRKVVIKSADYFQKALSFVHLSEYADTFEDFMEFRRSNEIAIVKLACERATEEDLEKIDKCVKRLDQNPSDFQADVDFHIELANASHNMIFATIMDYVNYMILDLRMRFFALPNYHDKTVSAHRRIYEAVKDRDSERAAIEMSRHLSIIEAYAAEEGSSGSSDKD
jgi:GntR family transcriptional regulator, transcriptional repressor for pyruvate dehydrogenase complex